MKIRIAPSAGFCFGVRRAIDIALAAASQQGPVYMLGDIVHNEFVVDQVRSAGVRVVKSLDNISHGVLLLRAHGTIPDIYKKAHERGLQIVDATCPMVLEIHKIVRQLERETDQVVIIGDHNHDEVRGIAGQIRRSLVVSQPEETDAWRARWNKIGVVVQSTQHIENVEKILARLVRFARDIHFINTICRPTADHQDEIRRMPQENDVMIIVGSLTSANTRRLTELSLHGNPRTYQVQSASELDSRWFEGVASVGISAGASTPDAIIQEVVAAIRRFRPDSNMAEVRPH